jgi:hypothetical protein
MGEIPELTGLAYQLDEHAMAPIDKRPLLIFSRYGYRIAGPSLFKLNRPVLGLFKAPN